MHNRINKIIINIPTFFASLKWCLMLSWQTSRFYTASRVLAEVLTPALTITAAFISRNVINLLAEQSEAAMRSESMLIYMLSGLFVIAVIRGISHKLTQYCQSMHDDKITAKIAMILMEHTLEADLEYFDEPDYYDKLNSASRDSYAINTVVWNSISIVSYGISFAAAFAILSQMSPIYGIAVGLSSIPASIVSAKFTKLLYNLSLEQINGMRKMEYIKSISSERIYAQDLRLFAIKEKLKERYLRIWKELFTKRQKASRKRTQLLCLLELLPELAIALICIDIAFRVINDNATVGDYSLLVGLTAQLWGTINILSSSAMNIYDNRMQLDNFRSIGNYKNQVCDSGDEELVKVETIDFINVTFSYPGTDKKALNGLSLSLHKGKKTALVGINGSGKSTFIKLLLRFYDPDEGIIFINGVDIRKYTLASLRANFSVYFQDMSNFSFTLRENFSFTDYGYSSKNAEEAMNKALSASSCEEILVKCYRGLDTNLTRFFSDDGIQLSGGQHQKIALARALFRRNTAFILDEPSSNLDPKAEHEVFEALRVLTNDKMTIFTSHRLSNTFLADKIVVLEDGRVAEVGTQIELLNNKQRFAELFKYQADKYAVK